MLLTVVAIARMSMNAREPQYIVSADLGGTNFKAGVVSSSGEILHTARVPTPRGSDYPTILSTVRGLIDDLIMRCPPEVNQRRRGVSIGVPGIVSATTGDVTNCFNVFGHDIPTVHLGRDLRQLVGQEIKVERDVNLAALGEHWVGAGAGCGNLICIFIGTGIGAGLIVNGQIVRGARGAAGEFGHLTIDREGPRCGCGNKGCVEQYASGPAIARSLALKLRERGAGPSGGSIPRLPAEEPTAEEAFALARGGDEMATRVIQDACASLGTGIADLATLLNPELVILGGGVGRQFDFIADRIRSEVRARCRPAVADAVTFVPSALWDDAAIVGGARNFFDL